MTEGRIRLAPILRSDLATLFAWINNREQVLFNSAYKPVHELSHLDWFETIQKREDVVMFAIRTIAEERLIGTCQILAIDPVHRSAELQIRVGEKSERGKGIGTEALRDLINVAFRDLNLNRVCARIFSTNRASLRAFEKAGLNTEGVLRQAAHIDGAYADVVMLGLLRADHV
jgi:RimJ/RimL family protein N-acetyltransferase